jgi:hypothetical protein
VTGYDLLQVFVDGQYVVEAWRGVEKSLPLPQSVCKDKRSEGVVELALLVVPYGRDNFFNSGQPEQVQKGIVGHVWLDRHGQKSVLLQGWSVSAMPLIQPGKVLSWAGEPAAVSTREMMESVDRMPFDSQHGGVWRNLTRQHPSAAGKRKLHADAVNSFDITAQISGSMDSDDLLKTAGISNRRHPDRVLELEAGKRLKQGPVFYRYSVHNMCRHISHRVHTHPVLWCLANCTLAVQGRIFGNRIGAA